MGAKPLFEVSDGYFFGINGSLLKRIEHVAQNELFASKISCVQGRFPYGPMGHGQFPEQTPVVCAHAVIAQLAMDNVERCANEVCIVIRHDQKRLASLHHFHLSVPRKRIARGSAAGGKVQISEACKNFSRRSGARYNFVAKGFGRFVDKGPVAFSYAQPDVVFRKAEVHEAVKGGGALRPVLQKRQSNCGNAVGRIFLKNYTTIRKVFTNLEKATLEQGFCFLGQSAMLQAQGGQAVPVEGFLLVWGNAVRHENGGNKPAVVVYPET